MLSAEPLVDHDADAALWRIRESYSDAALASSGMWEQLQDPFEAKTDVEATVQTIDKPIHFVLNLDDSNWAPASLNLAAGSGSYTDCSRSALPANFPSSVHGLRRKLFDKTKQLAATSIEPDHEHMPRQNDSESSASGPLALYAMHRRAAGLPMSMKAKRASEVCARLRIVYAAIAARILSATEAAALLWEL